VTPGVRLFWGGCSFMFGEGVAWRVCTEHRSLSILDSWHGFSRSVDIMRVGPMYRQSSSWGVGMGDGSGQWQQHCVSDVDLSGARDSDGFILFGPWCSRAMVCRSPLPGVGKLAMVVVRVQGAPPRPVFDRGQRRLLPNAAERGRAATVHVHHQCITATAGTDPECFPPE
jgi:hypothetical protein